jgi:glutathione peroxidase
LAPFKGHVVLVVNVASKCGLTPQYAALENLYQQYKAKGFSVLGLPCNQFAGQEPGTEQEIQEFCSLNYGVTFPLSSKLEVNGHERHQLYKLLAGEGAEFLVTSPGTSKSSSWEKTGVYWRGSRHVRRRTIRASFRRLKKP